MAYGLIRDFHVSFVVISGVLFVVRALASMLRARWLQRRWARAVPHVIDTLLLTMGVWMLIKIGIWPTELPWLMAKLIALVVYIILGARAIKRGRTPQSKAAFAVLALTVFAYMIAVALTKSVIPWA